LAYVENQQLNTLYNNAFALIYPSLYEGFGIPVLEAQLAGCPVLAYNAPSVGEIIGDKTLVSQENTVESFLEKVKLLENEKIRNEIINRGFENATKYSWKRMQQQIIELYNEIEIK
ncbi:MAG: glycosyltransferase, partial [Prevotellaceae bacterium]|jgi:mannosyltransferase|nr:glycosyltransferase [Prevotellaceae bacterium]